LVTDFLDEVNEVNAIVDRALGDLYSPLIDLARSHVRRNRPPVRGAAVLAAAYTAGDDLVLRARRLALAASLEMLVVAISIHALLLTATTDGATTDRSLDKSLVGSTILTGDYCFSRAAVLAAETESPAIAALFARALKTVSEEQLKSISDSTGARFDPGPTLVAAGVDAAAQLAGLSSIEQAAAHDFAMILLDTDGRRTVEPSLASPLSAIQQGRWNAALEWSHTIG
jgi:octaprenyl-diphosphate synthase